jgi:aminomethyltransferase
MSDVLKTTPLDALNRELGGRMVPFAGYAMPVQYQAGILTEHLHCRAAAGLFDVSHMGQATLEGPGAVAALEALTPTDIAGLKPGRQRYSLLLTPEGTILDDFMVARIGAAELFLVVNAGCKEADFAHIAANLPPGTTLTRHEDRALIALQGPLAAEVFGRFAPEAMGMSFMDVRDFDIPGIGRIRASRSGYTGEDGFEISIPGATAEAFVRKLLAEHEVAPVGLGARDSLRLEAGLPLYGNDIDTTTTPVQAGLTFAINKRRKMAWDMPGGPLLRDQLDHGTARKRVGILPEGRAPARAGAEITDANGNVIGSITSGGFGPSVNAPIAMGYIDAAHAADGTAVALLVRGKSLPARIVPMPFVPHRYAR